ncbi:phage baseplate protein [Metasolibacillus sp.]|uniref:LysM peptidoglycan-binding domain-containing protein n=1 Tax=Metasolibacillus sp. TaxID=2703680 RepID=UPI0025D934B3|nr:LysM peptidoglycan-binding domain-containing protein [Metasolibacillus sp.]MCT6926171.1 LysM peptidoglycan-binding domain-containing protein [Metasolibacillus sp.]MCT6942396.1 LysM peptidoglycan-binding domain-containing protein [Metasolibacillus sp.]
MAKELVGTSKLHGLLIHVESEDASIDVDIPTHKVEKGINLSDHVERKPIVVKISGLLIRPTKDRVETLVKKLQKIETEGKAITYEGRRIYKKMLVSGLSIKATAKAVNGYQFSLMLTEVRIAQSSYVPPKTKAVTAPKAQAGRKQTANKKDNKNVTHVVKKGDTYSSLAKKYGVTVASLQKLNGYDSRKIPIGAKLKIG